MTAECKSPQISRRTLLQVAGGAVLTSALLHRVGSAALARPPKRVIVAGGGIGGLCTAFELMDRGHDVTVLEASGRAGGHVKTIRDPLADGLYADVGAEHFTKPGYTKYWKYVERFKLPFLVYPRRIAMQRRIDGRWYTEEQLQDPAVLKGFGFNAKEIEYIVRHGWTELPMMYLAPYLDAFADEYQPFSAGLDQLDEMPASELLIKDGASDAALRFNGLRRGDGTLAAKNNEVSALYRVWQMAIVKRRGLPVFKREVFRLVGGNQVLTDRFSAELGERVLLGAPVTSIAHSDLGVTVKYLQYGEPRKLEADYLVCCLPLSLLSKIPTTPDWPESKRFVLENTKFSSQSRVLLQARTKFWEPELPSINLETGEGAMYTTYQTADEVPSSRSVLMGSGKPDVTADEALAAFRKVYPGKQQPTIEQAYVYNWSRDPWSMHCERYPFALGALKKFWPHLMRAVGRIHFAGCHADNMPWGMDAATRSANCVAEIIDQL